MLLVLITGRNSLGNKLCSSPGSVGIKGITLGHTFSSCYVEICIVFASTAFVTSPARSCANAWVEFLVQLLDDDVRRWKLTVAIVAAAPKVSSVVDLRVEEPKIICVWLCSWEFLQIKPPRNPPKTQNNFHHTFGKITKKVVCVFINIF